MLKNSDKKLTSINLDKGLYKDCKKKLLDDNISFIDLINNCIHQYISGSLNFSKYKINISGSL